MNLQKKKIKKMFEQGFKAGMGYALEEIRRLIRKEEDEKRNE